MGYRYIIYEPGRVARIKLNRPEYRNALSHLMEEEMDDAFRQADADDNVEVIVLSGEGPDFCTGHDLGSEEHLAEMTKRGLDKDEKAKYYTEKYHKMDMRLGWHYLSKPTIAMVHGWCIFGGEMISAAMDIIFASEDAKFLPGQAQFFTLPWDVGPRKAKEILFEHRVVSAREARELGWVNRVYPKERLEAETLAFANRVADNFRDRVRGLKLAINHMMDTMGFGTEIDYAWHANHIYRGFAYSSEQALAAGIEMGGGRRDRRVGRADTALENLKIKERTELR
jgi:enoyl-CoA hydratase